ncbi:polysaccharide biosynthesis/export family protein [Algoriphagus litoralis]|uniref:polysaccharide biosynthesis/export family protein n=1 Tax=Algoriphagus litoralis TaxID=2202829 RepID=UPI001E319D92|nr:polysaccharide biosynthesis/export family protein [Algoriphagus litoralis]
MKFDLKSVLVCLGFVFLISSCVSNKKLIYMQELEDSMGPLVESSKKYPYVSEEYLLQVNDIVEINIKTTDEKLNLVFGAVSNDSQNQAAMAGGQGAGDAFFMNGYTIDDEGMVEIPLLGKIKISGITTEETKQLVEKEVLKYINQNEFFVRVRLGGIRFSALGEFNKSGKYTILQNRVTIYEAIAFAGDLSKVAKRDEILLVRQYPDGSQIHKINLLDRDLLGSEYFFLKPNDMIYAEPMKVREIGAGNTLVETLTLLTTSITAIALILTLIQNNN